jgi:hypothetical protein
MHHSQGSEQLRSKGFLLLLVEAINKLLPGERLRAWLRNFSFVMPTFARCCRRRRLEPLGHLSARSPKSRSRICTG